MTILRKKNKHDISDKDAFALLETDRKIVKKAGGRSFFMQFY